MKAGLILDAHGRSRESVLRDGHQLQKSLQAAQNAERIGGMEFCARRRDVERVGLVFAQLLDRFAFVISGDHQRRFGGIGISVGKHNAGLVTECGQESLAGAVQPRFAKPGERQSEGIVDLQRAACRAAPWTAAALRSNQRELARAQTYRRSRARRIQIHSSTSWKDVPGSWSLPPGVPMRSTAIKTLQLITDESGTFLRHRTTVFHSRSSFGTEVRSVFRFCDRMCRGDSHLPI